MKKNTRNKYLLKNTLLLSLGNFGSKFLNFFLIPLYTNILTTAEYGTIDLITIIGAVVVPVLTLNIQDAVLRFSLDKACDNNKILNIAVIMIFFSSLIGLLCWPLLSNMFFTSHFAIYIVFYTLTFSTSHILLCYIRGKEKLLDYSIISIVQTLLIALLNIYFLVFLRLGINGYILSYIIGYIATIILCIIRGNIIISINKFNFDKNLFKKMIKYSIFLIPNSLMWWVMNSLDKVMITSYLGVEFNGIYAVSYKIPTILNSIALIFNQAWMYSAIKEKDSIDKEIYTNKIYSSLFNIVITIAVFLLLILKPIMSVYVGKDFYSAWLYVPFLLIGTAFITLGSFISNEYTVHKDSMGHLKSSTIGAITNFILNMILIPIIGIFGAAIATCISYIIVYIYISIDTRKYLKIKIIDKIKITLLIILLISTIVVYIENNISYLINLVLFFMTLLFTRNIWINIIRNMIKKIKR